MIRFRTSHNTAQQEFWGNEMVTMATN